MLEGKELEVAIGKIGQVSVDVNTKGEVEIALGVKINLLDELKKLAAKTQTPLDDKALEWVQLMIDKGA